MKKYNIITKKDVIGFLFLNIILISANTVDNIQYKNLLEQTVPEFPYHFWKEFISESMTILLFSFVICFSYSIYSYLKQLNSK